MWTLGITHKAVVSAGERPAVVLPAKDTVAASKQRLSPLSTDFYAPQDWSSSMRD